MRDHVFQNYFVTKSAEIICIISLSYHMLIYCNYAWRHCDRDSTIKTEKIQKRALRSILNDYKLSHDDLLKTTGYSLIYSCRLISIVLETFKSVYKIEPFISAWIIP